ncbi:hypothetical protein CHUAL_001980 [Chamberlinius hualienensis]
MIIVVNVVTVLFLLSTANGQQWTGSSALDATGSVMLFWKNDVGSITFEIQAPTKGYVGLGISPSGTMIDADIVTGYVANNNPQIKDRYSTKNELPVIDKVQNYELISGSENSTHTTLRFKRKLNTGDTEDKEITAGPITLIWAYGAADPLPGSDIDYHGLETREVLQNSEEPLEIMAANLLCSIILLSLGAVILSQMTKAVPVYNIEENYTIEGKNIIKREAKTTVAKTDLKSSATGQEHDSGYQDPPTSYVNFGAKTGAYGAYSWFSDHPVGAYGDAYGR